MNETFFHDITIRDFLGRSRLAHEFQGLTPTLHLQSSCVHYTIWHSPPFLHTTFEPFLSADYPTTLSQIYRCVLGDPQSSPGISV